MEPHEVARVVWEKCLSTRPSEKALVLSDPSGEQLEIAECLKQACPCQCDLVKMEPTGMHGREPPMTVASRMLDYSIVIASTAYSLTHTKAIAGFNAKGGRAVSMPGITMEMFMRAVPADYDVITRNNKAIGQAIAKSLQLRLTTGAGTDISMEVAYGRKICNDNGIVAAGKVKNLPDGEVAIAPREGSANGTIIFDLSSLGKKLEKPFRVVVKEGLMVSCENEELWRTLRMSKNGTNLAELGIGTNPNAKVTGNILEDEKVLGTAHIAFGTNAALGGTVQTDVHLDSVMDKPTLKADGKFIIKEGKFLV